jgi:hypothetical protein
MPNWKKIIVSGSDASLNSLNVISATGSFNGTFVGDGSGLINLPIPNTGYSNTHTQSTPNTVWVFTHNLNTKSPLVQVYNQNYEQIIPKQIIGITPFTVEIIFDYYESGFAIASTGGKLEVIGSSPILIQSEADTTWIFNHNLGVKYPSFEVYDTNDLVIIPDGIRAINETTAEIYFATPTSGVVIANFSGIDGVLPTSISASNAETASYSDIFNIGQSQTQYSNVESSVNGTNILYNIETGSYTSAFFKYSIMSGSNARAGEVMSVWNGSNIVFTDNSTSDIGTTSMVTASAELFNNNLQFNMVTNTIGWHIKCIGTFM